MALTQINDTQPICFDDQGGSFEIVDGANSYGVNNVQSGTLRIREGLRDLKEYDDFSVLKSPLLGKPRPSEIELDCKYVGEILAAELRGLLVADGATGLAKQYTVNIKIPDYQGATTGKQIQFTRCYVMDQLEITGGEKFDTIKIKLKSLDHKAAVTAY